MAGLADQPPALKDHRKTGGCLPPDVPAGHPPEDICSKKKAAAPLLTFLKAVPPIH
jgi:hypothetical protein